MSVHLDAEWGQNKHTADKENKPRILGLSRWRGQTKHVTLLAVRAVQCRRWPYYYGCLRGRPVPLIIFFPSPDGMGTVAVEP